MKEVLTVLVYRLLYKKLPRGEESLLIYYQTNPDQVEKLNNKIMSELQLVADGKINIDEVLQ